MLVTNLPTEAIALDAYYIASAIVHQQDQEARMRKAIALEGLMSSRASRLSAEIVRLEVLIQERKQNWIATHGTSTVWTQHLDGCKYQNKFAA